MNKPATTAWLFLAAAILLEVTATVSMKAALDNPALYSLMVVGYLGSFVCLTVALRHGIALGVAYGIWGASGVALTAVFSALLFSDPLTAVMGLGIVLIVGGVLCVEIGSQAAQKKQEVA